MLRFRALFILYVVLALSFQLSATTDDTVDPYRYLPTIQFDGTDNFNKGEPNYPHRIDFNTTQDANNDSIVDAEDAMENLILRAIGNNLVDTGRTGLPGRGPNDQRPAVYFHYVDYDSLRVYQYWYYYADNNWINNHEHDWQYIFVYEQCGRPTHVLLNYHYFTTIYRWDDLQKDTTTHIIAAVEGGSHGFQNGTQDGVEIQYNGRINLRNGYLDTLTNDSIPWLIFSNDTPTVNTLSYNQQPDTFFAGDDDYPFPNPCERCDPRDAPWVRTNWNQPPLPSFGNCPSPKASFSYYSNKLNVQCYDSSKNVTGWYWTFGDGQTDTIPNPTHTYSKPGTYRICLSVTDSCQDRIDCTCDTFSCLKPSADFQVTQTGIKEFTFSNNSQNNWAYFWRFGDGDTSTLPTPSHQYDSAGTYQACLIASSECLKDTSCQKVNITTTGSLGPSTNGSIRIGPDPRAQTLTFFVPAQIKEPIQIQIFDRLGRLMKKTEQSSSKNTFQVSFVGREQGIYLVRMRTSKRTITKKFIW